MARPVEISDAVIIDSARAVFLERGMKATTAQVAQRAGVSEGSIYSRFRTKAELFRTAMELATEPKWLRELPARVGSGSIESHLNEVGLAALDFFRLVLPISMMVWSDPEGRGDLTASSSDPGPARGTKCLAEYFRQEMRLGRIRQSDPEIVSQAFCGPLWNRVSIEVLFGRRLEGSGSDEEFVSALIRVLFQGLAPHSGGSRSGKPPPVAGSRTRTR